MCVWLCVVASRKSENATEKVFRAKKIFASWQLWQRKTSPQLLAPAARPPPVGADGVPGDRAFKSRGGLRASWFAMAHQAHDSPRFDVPGAIGRWFRKRAKAEIDPVASRHFARHSFAGVRACLPGIGGRHLYYRDRTWFRLFSPENYGTSVLRPRRGWRVRGQSHRRRVRRGTYLGLSQILAHCLPILVPEGSITSADCLQSNYSRGHITKD